VATVHIASPYGIMRLGKAFVDDRRHSFVDDRRHSFVDDRRHSFVDKKQTFHC
jgi:hypothetical protein